MQTLLLNACYTPLDVIDWRRAMSLWCQGKVEIVETHDKEARAVTFTFKLPAVVRLLQYVRTKRRQLVQFTRQNIYTRDKYTCQYCDKKFQADALTFDHVLPVSRGGLRTWENIVTACAPCNRRKADRTPEEAGLTLRRRPVRPIYSPEFRVTIGIRQTPESWMEYLYWTVELENDNDDPKSSFD